MEALRASTSGVDQALPYGGNLDSRISLIRSRSGLPALNKGSRGGQSPSVGGGVGGAAVDVGSGVSGGFSDQAQIVTATIIARMITTRKRPAFIPHPGLISVCIADSRDQTKSPSRGWGFVVGQRGRGELTAKGGVRAERAESKRVPPVRHLAANGLKAH